MINDYSWISQRHNSVASFVVILVALANPTTTVRRLSLTPLLPQGDYAPSFHFGVVPTTAPVPHLQYVVKKIQQAAASSPMDIPHEQTNISEREALVQHRRK